MEKILMSLFRFAAIARVKNTTKARSILTPLSVRLRHYLEQQKPTFEQRVMNGGLRFLIDHYLSHTFDGQGKLYTYGSQDGYLHFELEAGARVRQQQRPPRRRRLTTMIVAFPLQKMSERSKHLQLPVRGCGSESQ
jgi:hypothetical protein